MRDASIRHRIASHRLTLQLLLDGLVDAEEDRRGGDDAGEIAREARVHATHAARSLERLELFLGGHAPSKCLKPRLDRVERVQRRLDRAARDGARQQVVHGDPEIAVALLLLLRRLPAAPKGQSQWLRWRMRDIRHQRPRSGLAPAHGAPQIRARGPGERCAAHPMRGIPRDASRHARAAAAGEDEATRHE